MLTLKTEGNHVSATTTIANQESCSSEPEALPGRRGGLMRGAKNRPKWWRLGKGGLCSAMDARLSIEMMTIYNKRQKANIINII